MQTRLALLSAAAGGALALTGALAAPAFADVAPVAHDDNYSTPVNTNLVIGAPGVLSNDTDADGDPLAAQLVAGAQHGNVNVAGNGAFTYVPTTNYVGPDQFTYRACEVLTPAVLEARQLQIVPCDTATVFITVKGTIPVPTTTTVPPPVGGTTIVRPPRQTTTVTQPPATNTIVQPAPTIIVPPAQPPANTFITPQAPSSGAVATGDGSLA